MFCRSICSVQRQFVLSLDDAVRVRPPLRLSLALSMMGSWRPKTPTRPCQKPCHSIHVAARHKAGCAELRHGMTSFQKLALIFHTVMPPAGCQRTCNVPTWNLGSQHSFHFGSHPGPNISNDSIFRTSPDNPPFCSHANLIIAPPSCFRRLHALFVAPNRGHPWAGVSTLHRGKGRRQPAKRHLLCKINIAAYECLQSSCRPEEVHVPSGFIPKVHW
ncbi:hypothetical protein B0J12DRAFT_655619 [Macrophomina phaseolina]|uniref:Uncharacterized protein n=1 Tax=Macrophomina phaseolina TaxID=35725 RepID=A0ABQ8GH18_9PEZI|nr:hypothetical protein B0J12DRAFT_655619 [Macrophomina phaseolina]